MLLGTRMKQMISTREEVEREEQEMTYGEDEVDEPEDEL